MAWRLDDCWPYADAGGKYDIDIDSTSPHRGLPPCHGGGAYAPMRPPDRNNHTTRHQSQVAGDLFGFIADFGFTADVSAL